MESKASNNNKQVYEDFQPAFNWVHGEETDTLILMLSGFRRKELKVQLTPTRILKVSGEQKSEGNNNNNRSQRRRRFHKEFLVPKDIDTNAISAKFESGNLHVKLPKVLLNNIPSKLPQTTTHEKVDNQEVINNPPKPRDHKAKAKEEAKSGDDELISQKKENENVIPCLNYSAKEAIVGLLVKVKKHKNLTNLLLLIVAILLVILVLGFVLHLITMQSEGGISMLIYGNRSAEVCDHTLISSHV